MASVESLSDSEIRLKLNELGYPAGPITATTRKVLVKKLKLLLEQQSTTPNDKKDGKSQVSLSSFSSGEESEDDAKVNSRSSMPPPPPKSGKRRSVSRSKETNSTNHNFDDTSLNNYLVPSANSTLKPRESPKRKIENHNGENISLSSVQDFPRRSVRNSVSPSNKVKPVAKDDPFDTGSDSDLGSENDVRNYSASKGSLFKNHKTLKDEESSFGGSEFAQSIRSRFQTVSAGTSDNSEFSKYTSLYRRSKTGDDSQLFKNNQPFSSDFVRKLSASSNKTISGFNSGLSSKLLNVKESDEENQPSPYFYSQIKSRLHKNDVPKTDEGRLWRNTTTVSMTLLLVVVLFFSFLIIVYLNVTYKDAPVEEADTQFPICRSNGKAGVECILDADMEPAMNLFKELYHDLQKHAISVKCKGNTEEISTLTDNQLIQIVVEKNSNLNVWDVENQLKNVKVLINANPKWGIEITENGLDIPSPALPFTCSALNFVYSVFGFGLRLVFGQ
uniref:LEM domain-containing protein n=1 Tax=Clastoptera arizonana TaxID=38151 RepID=A0A1B6D0B1_9HEMI